MSAQYPNKGKKNIEFTIMQILKLNSCVINVYKMYKVFKKKIVFVRFFTFFLSKQQIHISTHATEYLNRFIRFYCIHYWSLKLQIRNRWIHRRFRKCESFLFVCAIIWASQNVLPILFTLTRSAIRCGPFLFFFLVQAVLCTHFLEI